MTLVDPKLLKSFVVLADRLSFTLAAQDLGMSQPTLTLQIRKLEAAVGFALFQRTTRRIALTPQGADLLPDARRLTEEAERVARRIRLIARRARPQIRLGTPSYMLDVPVRNRLIDQFAASHPRTGIVIVNDWQPRLLREMAGGRIDAALVAGVAADPGWMGRPGRRSYEGLFPATLRTVLLARQRIGLLVPRELPLAGAGEIDPEALADQAIVTLPNTCPPVFDPLYALFDACGVSKIRHAEVHSVAIQRYARRARLPVVSVGLFDDQSGPDDDMVRCFIAGMEQTIDLRLAAPPDSGGAELAALFEVARRCGAASPAAAARPG